MITGHATRNGERTPITRHTTSEVIDAAERMGFRRVEMLGEVYLYLQGEWVVL